MTIDEQMTHLIRGSEAVYSVDELRAKLQKSADSGRPLRVKLGMDPTAPDIHLGHSVQLRKMRQFQDLGHTAVLIIGDYTAMVGDPTGKSQTRPMLTTDEIKANAETYFQQAGKVLDLDPARCEIRYNSEWLGQMNFADVLRLASRKTVARMLERDTFEKRFKAQQEIGIHELLYPLMQGWDSVMIDADIELGGTDQTFNNLVGRDLQKIENRPLQVVLIMPILVGLDGTEKMSKSLGNYIGVTDAPVNMFGKIMSIPDELMANYYTLLTAEAPTTFEPLIASQPRDAKVALGRLVVEQYHGADSAAQAEAEFFKAMRGDLPSDIPAHAIAPTELADGQIAAGRLAVLCGFAKSNGEARRLINEGGLRLNQEKLSDPSASVTIKDGDIVQRGKRKFLKISIGA